MLRSALRHPVFRRIARAADVVAGVLVLALTGGAVLLFFAYVLVLAFAEAQP